MWRDTEIFNLIRREQQRQNEGLELIASENFVSQQVLEATGSILTNKYAEGLPKRRYYGGCDIVDHIEGLAIDRAKQLFGASWANVQPHSGSQANAAVMLAVLEPGDKILGFDLAHGGHLTHGSPVNFSGKLYRASFYGVDPDTGRIDWSSVAELAQRVKPKLIICGASAYSRDWNYARLRQIADGVGAFLLADIAHPAGLIARGLLRNPIPDAHFVTTTTHKTLRGPRGGMIMMGQDFDNDMGRRTAKGVLKKMSAVLDSSVFPGIQGGPLEHVIAAKAVCFHEAMTDAYLAYVTQVQDNARALATHLIQSGYLIVSHGTDNHLMLVDLTAQNITGKEAESALGKAGITVNKNMIPSDLRSPLVTSGIRIGVSAVTTRGAKTMDMKRIAAWIEAVLRNAKDPQKLEKIRAEVKEWGRTLNPISTCGEMAFQAT